MGITCKQATEYIIKKEEGRVTATQRFQLWRHLAICSLCKFFYNQNRVMATALSKETVPDDVTLSAEEKESIVKAIKEDS